MEYILIKNTNLKVSRLCMGGCPMGGYGWGKINDEYLINAIHTAIDSGITMFDTADVYGMGKSEEILSRGIGKARNKVIIATKFGVKRVDGKTIYDNSPTYIKMACEASLKRLNTDYIDIYQVHYRDDTTPLYCVLDTLKVLQKQGKIRYFGLSNIYEKDILELKEYIKEFVSFQDEYSLACRKYENDILKIQQELQMTPFTWGSLGQGILTGKYDSNVTFKSDDRRSKKTYVNFHGKKLLKNLDIVNEMKIIQTEIENNYGRKLSLSAIAIRFILDHIPDSVVLAGAKTSEQVKSNIEAFGWKLSQEQLLRLSNISAYDGGEHENFSNWS